MPEFLIDGDVLEHAVIKDEERTSEGDGPAFNKAAIKVLAAFNEAVGKQDTTQAVDYHLVLVAKQTDGPVRVVDRSERARRPTEILKKPSGKGACRDGTCPGVRLTPRTEPHVDPAKEG